MVTKLEITRRYLEDEAISKCKPSNRGNAVAIGLELTAMQISPTPNTTAMISAINNAGKELSNGTPALTSAAQTPRSSMSPNASVFNHSYEKEGYLFKRSGQKTSIVVPTWSRRYFVVKNGNFWYSITNTSGKNRGYVMSTSPVNVLLCNIRVAKDITDRRFCFEVYTSRKSFVLQAETEEDYLDWIETFQSAKYHATLSDRKLESMMTHGVGPKTAALIQEGMETSLPRNLASVGNALPDDGAAITNAIEDDTDSDDDGEKLHKDVKSSIMILKKVKNDVERSISEENSIPESGTTPQTVENGSATEVPSAEK